MKSIALVAVLILSGCVAKQPPLPVYGQIPSFALTDETGRPFDQKSLDGTVWVAAFIFTPCTAPCPRMAPPLNPVPHAPPRLFPSRAWRQRAR